MKANKEKINKKRKLIGDIGNIDGKHHSFWSQIKYNLYAQQKDFKKRV